MEAQRFPEDYDGILAGAPANAWSTMLAAGAGAMQRLLSDPEGYIPDRKLFAIGRATCLHPLSNPCEMPIFGSKSEPVETCGRGCSLTYGQRVYLLEFG